MKPNGHTAGPVTQRGLTDHQFERLIVFYSDAEGLRRGFQFWMGWMGGGEHGCDCVPVYLGHEQPNASVCGVLKNRSRKTLTLYSPPRARGVVELPEAVFAVLAREAATERCMVVLGEDETTEVSWSLHTGSSLEQLFGLGTFVAYPNNSSAGRTGPKCYELLGPVTRAGAKSAKGKRSKP